MYDSDVKHPSRSLHEKLQSLYNLSRGGRIELGFRKAYLDLLKKFGNPHLSLPPVIHVAGTNGKGSTIAFMRAMLEAEGYKVHVYTSPHLIEFNERIVLGGKEIDDVTLESLIDEALVFNGGADITFFEITTAMAFAAFVRHDADVTLVEVGLGGRLDCTNVIEKPMLSVITPVSMDHEAFLGDTLLEIAEEKAGIIKPDVPYIISQQDVSESVFQPENALGHLYGRDWHIDRKNDEFCVSIRGVSDCYPAPILQGIHQIYNAGLAIAGLHLIHDKLPVAHDSILQGLQNAQWAGRLQDITALIPANIRRNHAKNIYLDGGHNPSAGEMINQFLSERGGSVNLVLAMLNHKDPRSFVKAFSGHVITIFVCEIPDEPQSLSVSELEYALQDLNITIVRCNSIKDALIKACGFENDILITGSLYLVGHVLGEIAKTA